MGVQNARGVPGDSDTKLLACGRWAFVQHVLSFLTCEVATTATHEIYALCTLYSNFGFQEIIVAPLAPQRDVLWANYSGAPCIRHKPEGLANCSKVLLLLAEEYRDVWLLDVVAKREGKATATRAKYI